MTIRTKVIGGFVLALSLAGSVSYYTYARARDTNQRLELVNQLFIPLSREIAQFQSNILALIEDLRRFYFRSDETPEMSANTRVARDLYPYVIYKRLESIDSLLERASTASHAVFIDDLKRSTREARQMFDLLMSQREKPKFEENYRSLLEIVASLSRRVEEESQSVTTAAQSDGSETLLTGLVLALVALTGGLAVLVIANRALSAIPQLSATLRRIADGDFSQSLKVRLHDKDEVGELARQFNRMLAALEERDRRIGEQQKEIVQNERLAAVGQLSAEVVHEIRNPLNAISLNIDWLQSEMGDYQDEIRRTLSSISREVERLHQITERYLIRARVSSGEPVKTEVNSLIQEILEFSREEDKLHNIRVVADITGQEIFVHADRSRLKQALLNLLRNAKEAMPQGGTLTVSTSCEANTSRVRIEDTGYGMNEATLRSTSRPFFTTKTNGTGLGLLLTRQIVEEARGSIDCRSELGKGTSFVLHFPV